MRTARGHKWGLLACLVAFVAILAVPAAAAGKPGALDRSFGKGGRVTRAADLGPRSWGSVRTATAELPSGNIVALAGRTLYGFKPNGLPASSFGGGTVKIAAPEGHLDIAGMTMDSRGRILVAGGSRSIPETDGEAPEHVFVARYTQRGKLDPSFGDNGVLLTDFGLPSPQSLEGWPVPVLPPTPQVRATGVAVDFADRIVLTGTRLRFIGPCRGSVALRYREAFIARLDQTGARDGFFGEAGVIPLPSIQGVNPPVVDSEGRIYVSTRPVGPCSEGQPALLGRLDSHGKSDLSFGEGGWVRPFAPRFPSIVPFSTALDPAGRLVLFAQRYFDPDELAQGHREKVLRVALVKRFLQDGAVDNGFGHRGVASTSGLPKDFSIRAGTVDPVGRVLLTGAFHQALFLGRFTPKAQIDRRFGKVGRVVTRFGLRSKGSGSSVMVDGHGRAVVAGLISSPHLRRGGGLALVRYRAGR